MHIIVKQQLSLTVLYNIFTSFIIFTYIYIYIYVYVIFNFTIILESDHMEAYYANCGNELSGIEYEEVILEKSKNCPRLGLKLYYDTANNNDTDIFIGEVESGSVADRDGRLRPGDQILQVNGETIYSRANAVKQFRNSGNEISLLLARSIQNEEFELLLEPTGEGCNDDDKSALTDANSSNSTLEKDSGLSRMTDSDPELLPAPIASSLNQSMDSLNDLPEVTDFSLRRCASECSLERELASLHREMETIRMECDRLILKHSDSGRGFPKMLHVAGNDQNVYKLNDDVKRKLDDTSSDYNTGESCRSTPLKPDAIAQTKKSSDNMQSHNNCAILDGSACDTVRCIASQKPSTSQISQVKFRLPQYSVILRESGKKGHVTAKVNEEEELRMNDGKRPLMKQMVNEPYRSQSDKAGITMYTMPQKLAETIALQQRLLREAMVEQAHMLRTSAKSGTINNATTNNHNNDERRRGMGRIEGTIMKQFQNDKIPEACEWKIKRRSDGTRYVTRKPIRNKLLKEREEQLNKERTGVSTDDDAMSELKTGRFWTREERKKQWERAKQRKLRYHQLMAQRNQQPSDQLIVQLSRKKMMRRKGNPLLDKFTTIQEFMAHANSDISSRPIDGILSVTTV
uniref:Bm2881 n=2 Tax=Brugia malayi TaxID=6279 RepID=A0A0H5SMZ3_BRUMA|nr:Bm2881 [Brugia malayi]